MLHKLAVQKRKPFVKGPNHNFWAPRKARSFWFIEQPGGIWGDGYRMGASKAGNLLFRMYPDLFSVLGLF